MHYQQYNSKFMFYFYSQDFNSLGVGVPFLSVKLTVFFLMGLLKYFYNKEKVVIMKI